MTTKNIQDVVAEKVDVAVYDLLFSGLSIEQMDKIPEWLLENMEKNKEDVKTTLTQLVKEVEAGEREATIRDMEKKMIGWAGTAKAMLKDYRKIIYRTPPTSDVIEK